MKVYNIATYMLYIYDWRNVLYSRCYGATLHSTNITYKAINIFIMQISNFGTSTTVLLYRHVASSYATAPIYHGAGVQWAYCWCLCRSQVTHMAANISCSGVLDDGYSAVMSLVQSRNSIDERIRTTMLGRRRNHNLWHCWNTLW